MTFFENLLASFLLTGIFSILLLSLLYLRSLDPKYILKVNIFYAAGAGLSLGYIFASWGASRYVLSLIALTTFVLLVMKRYSRRLLISYGVTAGIGLLMAVSVPKLGFSFLREFEVKRETLNSQLH